MNTPMHIHIAETSLNWLTGDCAEFWLPQRATISKAANYPDYFTVDKPENSQIDPDWQEFTLIPDAGNALAHGIMSPLKIRKTYPPIINHWTAKVIENIHPGNLEKAAKFIGCLSHIIGDTGQAAHVFNEQDLKRLLPQGDKPFVFHSAMEKVNGKITLQQYTPRILGKSLDELNWRLLEELEILKRNNTAEVIPLVKALMDGDNAAAEASASRSLTSCAKLFADLLLSCWNTGLNITDNLPYELDLRQFVPINQKCDMLFNYEVMIDRIPGKTIDTPLALNLGNNDVQGLALLPNLSPFMRDVRESWVEFSIPPGAFKYFETEIGLNRGSINETKAIFMVKLDDKTVYTSKPLGINDPAEKIKVKLGNAQTIQLYVRDSRPAPCNTKFFYPVFATPRLSDRII